MNCLFRVMWTVTVTIALVVAPASYAANCHITPYSTPAKDQARLDSGLVGQWDNSFQQQMISIRDYDGNQWDYFSLQKKPDTAEPQRLVLLLHGFPEFAWAWEKELAYFGDKVHAVALDLKGHHYSSAPDDTGEYNFLEIGWEMREVIRCLGYDKATIVGHDFGGAIGWIMGMLHPDAVDGLVIMNVPHPYLFGRELLNPASDQQERIQYMVYARGTSLKDQLNFSRIIFSDTSIFNSGFYAGKRLLRLVNENWLPLNRWREMKNYYREMPLPATEQDYPAELSRFQKKIYSVKVPTLVLWGLADPYFSPNVLTDLPALVPQLELVTYPHGTHWINHEADDLHQRIDAFLQRTGPALQPAPQQ